MAEQRAWAGTIANKAHEQSLQYAVSSRVVLVIIQETPPPPPPPSAALEDPEGKLSSLMVLSTHRIHFLIVGGFYSQVALQKREAEGTVRTKAAHETLLDTLEALCFQAGIKMERRNIPSVTKPNGKIGQGDLVLKNVNLGGHRHRKCQC